MSSASQGSGSPKAAIGPVIGVGHPIFMVFGIEAAGMIAKYIPTDTMITTSAPIAIFLVLAAAIKYNIGKCCLNKYFYEIFNNANAIIYTPERKTRTFGFRTVSKKNGSGI